MKYILLLTPNGHEYVLENESYRLRIVIFCKLLLSTQIFKSERIRYRRNLNSHSSFLNSTNSNDKRKPCIRSVWIKRKMLDFWILDKNCTKITLYTCWGSSPSQNAQKKSGCLWLLIYGSTFLGVHGFWNPRLRL